METSVYVGHFCVLVTQETCAAGCREVWPFVLLDAELTTFSMRNDSFTILKFNSAGMMPDEHCLEVCATSSAAVSCTPTLTASHSSCLIVLSTTVIR